VYCGFSIVGPAGTTTTWSGGVADTGGVGLDPQPRAKAAASPAVR
jgi:hypothetical protein